MKDLKFRLIKDGKIVGYERHRECRGEICIVHSKDGENWGSICWDEGLKYNFIPHDDKKQFTGLKDTGNVHEIYAGDKLKGVDEFSDKEVTGIVIFAGGSFGIGKIDKDGVGFNITPPIELNKH